MLSWILLLILGTHYRERKEKNVLILKKEGGGGEGGRGGRGAQKKVGL